jgi:lysophospholipase L1-like esterase
MFKTAIKMGLFLSITLTFSLPTTRGAVQQSIQSTPFTFTQQQQKSSYFTAFKKFDREDQQSFPQKDALLCIGSSSMRLWSTIQRDLQPLTITHRGFGGSTMAEVLRFKDFFARYHAERIMIYEGDNDIWYSGSTVEEFIENCKEFVSYIHRSAPQTEIIFISVKPSIKRQSKWHLHNKANTLLKAYTESDTRLSYIDVATPMLDKEGEPLTDIFSADKTHLNREGYKIWSSTIRTALGLPALKK